MHGAKGLDAAVVFIPGLEEEEFPGPRRTPYRGLCSNPHGYCMSQSLEQGQLVS